LKANRNITLDKVFAVKNVKGIEARTKIACLRPWLKQKIREDPFLYGVFSAKLLKKIRELLDIAAVGCHRESCADSMLDARSKFQDLMYTVVRASNNIVKETITIVKAHRYANRYPDKAAWVMGKHVEKKYMQNIIKEIAQLKTSAGKTDSAAQVLHQNVLTSTTEKRKTVKRYKKLLEQMKKNKEIAEGMIKDNENKKDKAIKVLDELEKKLDAGKRKVEKLMKEQDVYNKCEKRRRAKQQKSLKEYNEKKKNLDSEMSIKSKKCMELQQKIYSAPDDEDEENDEEECSLYRCTKAGNRADVNMKLFNGPCCRSSFRYNGTWHQKCILGKQTTPWCYTIEYKSTGRHWGFCLEFTCPFEDSPDAEGEQCIKSCADQKKLDDSINGVTIRKSGIEVCECHKKMLSKPASSKTCFLVPAGVSENECESRREEIRQERKDARRKLYTNCNKELQQLESTEITMEMAKPCTAWTKDQELFETSLDVSTLKIQVKTQKGLIALAEENVSKDKQKKPVVPSKDMVQETEEAVQDLVVAEESTLVAKKGLCLMKSIFQELKEKPSGVVKSVVFEDKNEDQVKKLLVISGFSWLAYGANVNVARKLLAKVKQEVTDSVTSARPSREEGRRLISSAATVKRDTRQLVGEIWSKHGLTCNQE